MIKRIEDISIILNRFSNLNKGDVFFLQIGSNDGKTGDPIYNFIARDNWEGIAIEPIKYLFDRLKTTYAYKSNIILLNKAVSLKSGTQKMYRLREGQINLPYWYEQLGTFNINILLKHKDRINNIEELIVEEEVETITLEELIDNYNLKKVSLLHIDAEGFDYEIIKMIDFSKLNIDILLFEKKHLSKELLVECTNYLSLNNYNLYSEKEGNDILCVNSTIKNLV